MWVPENNVVRMESSLEVVHKLLVLFALTVGHTESHVVVVVLSDK